MPPALHACVRRRDAAVYLSTFDLDLPPCCPAAIFYESRVPESALSISLDSHIRSLSCDLEGDTLACATGERGKLGARGLGRDG